MSINHRFAVAEIQDILNYYNNHGIPGSLMIDFLIKALDEDGNINHQILCSLVIEHLRDSIEMILIKEGIE